MQTERERETGELCCLVSIERDSVTRFYFNISVATFPLSDRYVFIKFNFLKKSLFLTNFMHYTGFQLPSDKMVAGCRYQSFYIRQDVLILDETSCRDTIMLSRCVVLWRVRNSRGEVTGTSSRQSFLMRRYQISPGQRFEDSETARAKFRYRSFVQRHKISQGT